MATPREMLYWAIGLMAGLTIWAAFALFHQIGRMGRTMVRGGIVPRPPSPDSVPITSLPGEGALYCPSCGDVLTITHGMPFTAVMQATDSFRRLHWNCTSRPH